MNDRTFHAKDAHKLENPDRLLWLPPADVIAQLNLRKAMTVADIGAGTGYFSIPMAQAVAPCGMVIAIDLQREMLDHISTKIQDGGSSLNIRLVNGEASHTTLDNQSVDVAFMANVWHELDDHQLVLDEMRRILHPDGRLVILDWRTDVSQPPGPPLHHRVSPENVSNILRMNRWTTFPSTHAGVYGYVVQAMRAA